MKFWFVFGLMACNCATWTAVAGPREREAQARLCMGMELEWYIPSTGARIDCLSATHAIEVDWTKNWDEAIGQALYYAYEVGLEPGIILVCKDPANDAALCLKRGLMTEATLAHYGIEATLWECDIDTVVLSECGEKQIGR